MRIFERGPGPRRLGTLILFALLLGLGLRFYMYGAGANAIPVTSDEAITVLQAVDIRSGKIPLLMAGQPYMFPVEAYWMAPFVELLPRTTWGMRALILAEGFAFLALLLALLRKCGPLNATWPGVLLALIPSAYLAMNQSAYSLPHNTSAYILVLAGSCLLFSLPSGGRSWYREAGLAFGAGFFALLAFSNSMLALALVAPLALVALCNAFGGKRWWQLAGFTLGGGAGLAPFLLGIWRMPGAHSSIACSNGLREAMERLWEPAVSVTMPGTFGFRPTVFPDDAERLAWGEWGYQSFPYIFTLLLILAIAFALGRVVRSIRSRSFPLLGPFEWAVGVTILNLLLFILSKRAESSSYRYLLPALVVFPVLLAGLYAHGPRVVRRILGALVILLAGYNVVTSVRLAQEWKRPNFARDVISAPDLRPALERLSELGIGHAVASHWAAYRIGFESAGAIVCTQPQNERFPGWPIPYKSEVDAAAKIAYVLTEHIRFLKPSIFDRHLKTMGVEAIREEAGEFVIYHGFRSPAHDRLTRIAPYQVRASAAENPDDASLMMDGKVERYWRSASLQNTSQWVEFTFAEPMQIERAVLHYGAFAHDRARALRFRVLTASGWETVHDHLSVEMDKFAWRAGKPLYGHAQQTFPVERSGVRSLRIEIAEPEPRFCWTLAEVYLYEAQPILMPQ